MIPVFVLDDVLDSTGAAAKLWLKLSLERYTEQLRALGSRLILRRGDPETVLLELARESDAEQVFWTREYHTAERDKGIKSALQDAGLEVQSFPGLTLHEPWAIQTGSGGPYKVYTPFWKKLRTLDIGAQLPAPAALTPPETWPTSGVISAWTLERGMDRVAGIFAERIDPGEQAAQARLSEFLEQDVAEYPELRDRPDLGRTSRLSAHLAWGEISAREAYAAAQQAHLDGNPGAEAWMRQIAWRDFAWQLAFNTPQLLTGNWREEWALFPWREDNEDAERWRRALTGEPIVDAGMRELYVTGWMHNRVRMIVASYLCKHLQTHWQVGEAWFADTLVDFDPANNAMGWQWVAGSGPDASPYFRVFNPEGQAKRYDKAGDYQAYWLEGEGAELWYQTIPRSWGQSPEDARPERLIGLKQGRQRALDAYEAFKQKR